MNLCRDIELCPTSPVFCSYTRIRLSNKIPFFREELRRTFLLLLEYCKLQLPLTKLPLITHNLFENIYQFCDKNSLMKGNLNILTKEQPFTCSIRKVRYKNLNRTVKTPKFLVRVQLKSLNEKT